MTCDLSDPKIGEAYGRILSGDGIDWMVIGYGSTRDRLSLYASGDGSVAEMALQVPDEVAFCFVLFEGSRVLVTHVSEKISGVQRARGLAHQKEVAEFFSHHDVTVNTSKPSELTPTMLRDKTRHLAIKAVPMKVMAVRTRVRILFSKVVGSLGRSDSVQNAKLRSSVWHQRSNGSSLPSSPLTASFGPDTTTAAATPNDASDMVIIPEEEPPAELAAESADTAAPEAPQEPAVLPAEDPACPDPEAPAAPAVAADSDGNDNAVRPQSPAMEAPPTPKSFSDLAPSVVAAPSSTTHPALSPISDEFQQTDSPIFSTFGHSAQRGDSSSTIAESFIDPPSPAPVAASRPTSAAGPAPPATTVDQTGPAPARYGSLRVRADKGSLSRQDSSATPSPVSASAPSQIEVANMVSQVRARRATVVELADTVGILGDKYYECLRGYTSIQEPNSAFWKRRYFAVADKTLFMYTNECSRTPSDYLAMHGIVAPPRDAEDEVLMPHSIAVNFGKGECYMYFDTASMKQAFESEVRKATAAA